MEGTKTATASLLWAWEKEGEPLPIVGQCDVLLDWNNRFVGIIETTQIEVKPFNEVDSAFASFSSLSIAQSCLTRKVVRRHGRGASYVKGTKKPPWGGFEVA